MKSDRDARHKRAMQRRKEYVDGRIAAATEDRGLLLILTGNGKGKSSSAFGMLARSVGHGLRCAVVQFIKGTWECGERLLFEENPLVEFHIMGTGFTWETQDRQTDIAAAEAAWSKAEALLADKATDLVILDELTYMLTYGYLDKARVLEGPARAAGASACRRYRTQRQPRTARDGRYRKRSERSAPRLQSRRQGAEGTRLLMAKIAIVEQQAGAGFIRFDVEQYSAQAGERNVQRRALI